MKLHFDGKLKWTKFVADLIIFLFLVASGLGLKFFPGLTIGVAQG